jgi:hypothetical protein
MGKNIYVKGLEKILGETKFKFNTEDYSESKIFIITPKLTKDIVNDEGYVINKEEYNPPLFIYLDKVTGEAKGYARSLFYKDKAASIKIVIENTYKQEKMKEIFITKKYK